LKIYDFFYGGALRWHASYMQICVTWDSRSGKRPFKPRWDPLQL
jgi:hypothetical protein